MDDVALGRLLIETEEALLGASSSGRRTATSHGADLRPHLFTSGGKPAVHPHLIGTYLRLRERNPSFQTATAAAALIVRLAATRFLTQG